MNSINEENFIPYCHPLPKDSPLLDFKYPKLPEFLGKGHCSCAYNWVCGPHPTHLHPPNVGAWRVLRATSRSFRPRESCPFTAAQQTALPSPGHAGGAGRGSGGGWWRVGRGWSRHPWGPTDLTYTQAIITQILGFVLDTAPPARDVELLKY